MASFAAEVKNELARQTGGNECCRRAELTALIRLCGSLHLYAKRGFGLSVATNNAAVARKVLVLIKNFAPRSACDILTRRTKRLLKNIVYILKLDPGNQTECLLGKLGLIKDGLPDLNIDGRAINKNCCRAAYLRGAFLGGGSVNRPEARSNLEIVTENDAAATFIQNLMLKFGLPAYRRERDESYVVYMKDGEGIIDLLTMLRAPLAAEQLEVGRNIKEVRCQVNRLVNCETANLAKSVDAAARQAADIRRIAASPLWDTLSPALRETATARLASPEAGLEELAADLCISKSGLNHRMRKFHALAVELEKTGVPFTPSA